MDGGSIINQVFVFVFVNVFVFVSVCICLLYLSLDVIRRRQWMEAQLSMWELAASSLHWIRLKIHK